MEDFLSKLTTNQNMYRIVLTLFLAESLFKEKELYDSILASEPSAANFTDAQTQAIKAFTEMRLKSLGLRSSVKLLETVLLDPDSNWDSLGLQTINEQTMGGPLTQAQKNEIFQILDSLASSFLQNIAQELNTLIGA